MEQDAVVDRDRVPRNPLRGPSLRLEEENQLDLWVLPDALQTGLIVLSSADKPLQRFDQLLELRKEEGPLRVVRLSPDILQDIVQVLVALGQRDSVERGEFNRTALALLSLVLKCYPAAVTSRLLV